MLAGHAAGTGDNAGMRKALRCFFNSRDFESVAKQCPRNNAERRSGWFGFVSLWNRVPYCQEWFWAMHSPPLRSIKPVWEAAVRLLQPIKEWRDRRREERILLVTSPNRTWTLQGIAKRAKMNEKNAREALRRLREKGQVLSLHVDELPDETLWRRFSGEGSN